MSVFADLTKAQQLNYINAQIQHKLELRRLIQRHTSAVTSEEKAAIQLSIDTKVTEEPNIDSYVEA